MLSKGGRSRELVSIYGRNWSLVRIKQAERENAPWHGAAERRAHPFRKSATLFDFAEPRPRRRRADKTRTNNACCHKHRKRPPCCSLIRSPS